MFTVQDFHDLVQLLHAHPEWREELRALLLTPDILELPQAVQKLVAAVDRLVEGQERLVERVTRLEERQDRSEAIQREILDRLDRAEEVQRGMLETQRSILDRLDRAEEVQRGIIETQRGMLETQRSILDRLDRAEEVQRGIIETQRGMLETQRSILDRLDRAEEVQRGIIETQRGMLETQRSILDRLDRAEEVQRGMLETQRRLVNQVGELRGWRLEERYRTHAYAYFGRFLRQLKVVELGQLIEPLREQLEEAEIEELLRTDLFLSGRPLTPAGLQEVWLVVEVSAKIDRRDVERVHQRAELLRKGGYRVVPVAGGYEATRGAREAAPRLGVVLLQDGRPKGWQEALERALR